MRTNLLMLVLLCCVGCHPLAPPITDNMVGATGADEDNHRVKVRRIDVIEDWTAYQNRRGIYVITDTKTGKEYIGVSGIGITETGTHSAGKNSTAGDER